VIKMIDRVDIIGNGIMGKGIAHNFAIMGIRVFLWGRRSREEVRKDYKEYIEHEKLKKRIDAATFEKILKNTNFGSLSDAGQLFEAEFVIECIVENLAEKQKILNFLSGYCKESAIITSNTSTLPISELAQSVKDPTCFLGTHFFSPVPYNSLVEVSKTGSTSKSAVDKVLDILQFIGKSPFAVENSPGFIFNRIFLCTLNEAIYLLQGEKNATPEKIDEIFCMGWNMKYGPFRLIDSIGLDTILNCLNNLFAYYHSDKYKPAQLLVDFVSKGRLGRKSGKGFYIYAQNQGVIS
jgi:3-hydroxybutyryl-CoA dehydrogenase